MANYFTRFLKGAVEGATNPKGQQSNYRHAERLFIDNNFRLSPKTKFLFYVRFDINAWAARSSAFTDKHRQEVGLLVKATDLPKFNFESVVKNQYNRKKIIYKNFNYEPITITMRDDSHGIVNAMWALYYGYYIADRAQPSYAFDANQYRSKVMSNAYRYGLDNDISDVGFFNSIEIYTLSRRRFIGYTLVNPKIKSWNHGGMDYSASDFNESTMSVEYEAVRYSAGDVAYNSPQGFAQLHYDQVPSPLSVAGGGVSTLLGPGGVLDGLESIFGNIGNGTAFSNPRNFLSTAIASINTYKNISNLTGSQLKAEALNVLTNPRVITSAVSTVGGLVGSIFPKSSAASNNQTTDASPKSFPAPPDIG
jgi:hypothetical protein